MEKIRKKVAFIIKGFRTVVFIFIAIFIDILYRVRTDWILVV